MLFQTLSGCVESVEDHGYLIDIGVSGTKAFLPKEKTKDEAETSKRGKIFQWNNGSTIKGYS